MQNLVPLAKALQERGVAFGVIYDADITSAGDKSRTRNAVSHYTKIESDLGLHPEHACFETWVRYPSRMSPENQPCTMTNLVLQYIQQARVKVE